MKEDKAIDPFQYMIGKRRTILRAISETTTLPKAWNVLLERLPEIENVIRFNTFKVYAPILVKFCQIVDERECELDKVRQQIAAKEITETPAHTPSTPKRFLGWGVQLNNKGYYRLFKKSDGKVRWIYIGKNWNESIATQKINDFRLDKIS